MCIIPFCSLTGSLFAYTGHNESLIHCCHLQPTVSQSRINSWSNRAQEEQRIAGGWVSVCLFHWQTVDVLTGWVFYKSAVTPCSLLHFVLIVFCIFNFNVCHYSRDLLFICAAGIFRLWMDHFSVIQCQIKHCGADLFFFFFQIEHPVSNTLQRSCIHGNPISSLLYEQVRKHSVKCIPSSNFIKIYWFWAMDIFETDLEPGLGSRFNLDLCKICFMDQLPFTQQISTNFFLVISMVKMGLYFMMSRFENCSGSRMWIHIQITTKSLSMPNFIQIHAQFRFCW